MRPIESLALAAAALLPSSALAAPQGETWLDRYDGQWGLDEHVEDATVDSVGNLYVVGTTQQFIPPSTYKGLLLLLKYDPQGSLLWQKRWAGAGFGEEVVIDSDDHVIVAGSLNGGDDWALAKYDSNSVKQWSHVFDANAGFVSSVENLLVDGADNVYMGGSTAIVGGIFQATVVKYDPSGTLLWEQRYVGPSGDGVHLADFDVDAAGNVYGVGTADVPGRNDFCAFKMDPDGNVLWYAPFGIPSVLDMLAGFQIELDETGRLYATGTAFDWATGTNHIGLVRIDAATGSALWHRSYQGPGSGAGWPTTVAIDSQGSALVTGTVWGLAGDLDVATLKYDRSGNLLWDRTYGGSGGFNDYVLELAVDASGGVAVCGQALAAGPLHQFFTLAYGPTGTLELEQLYGGAPNDPSMARAAVFGRAGELYVSGISQDPSGDRDVVTIRYDGGSSPQVYCTSQTNSQGCTPSIASAGTPSATAGSGFTVSVRDLLNGKNGILFYGTSGPNQAPFKGGLLCVRSPLKRTGLRDSGGNPPPNDCSGAVGVDFNAWIATGRDGALAPGVRVWCQYWSRDPSAPFTTNLSDALTFLIGI